VNEARGIVIYLCREGGGKGLLEIGEVLGIQGAAVSLAAKRVRERMDTDPRSGTTGTAMQGAWRDSSGLNARPSRTSLRGVTILYQGSLTASGA
jgi:hypothetical protein